MHQNQDELSTSLQVEWVKIDWRDQFGNKQGNYEKGKGGVRVREPAEDKPNVTYPISIGIDAKSQYKW